MADIKLFAPKLAKLEGGYVNDPKDKGGCTNKGVTIAVYKSLINPHATCEDLKNIKDEEYQKVAKVYWDKWKADLINDQRIAEILVDWVYNSGVWGIKKPQKLLNLDEDGIVGNKTIEAVNAKEPKQFHDDVYAARQAFFMNIVRNNPSQQKFLKGWMNRLSHFK